MAAAPRISSERGKLEEVEVGVALFVSRGLELIQRTL
jgi:hypothetical protein